MVHAVDVLCMWMDMVDAMTTQYVNATHKTSKPFRLPSAAWASLRVLTDRSIVEAFGAEGWAAVSVLTFPSANATAIVAFCSTCRAHDSSSSTVLLSARVVRMGCGWLPGS